MLNQLEEVDGAVKKRGFEFALKVYIVAAGFVALNVVGEVDQSDDVNCKLAEYGPDDVGVEDVGLRPFFGEAFDGLLEMLIRTVSVYKQAHAYLGSRNG